MSMVSFDSFRNHKVEGTVVYGMTKSVETVQYCIIILYECTRKDVQEYRTEY